MKSVFYKAIIATLAAVLLLTMLCGCGKKAHGAETAEPVATAAPVSTAAPISTVEPDESHEPAAAEPGRQDGERFEAAIVLEGMEETVRYEHVRNEMVGIEMDYDYELFKRSSEPLSESFFSIYDSPDHPENYLTVTRLAKDADTAAASIAEKLSEEYEIDMAPYLLDRAGSCIRIDASAEKGSLTMPDQLQTVYIIPADDGCRVAIAHYAIEGAEGFGRRFFYMMQTLTVIERKG